ncbi:MAG TPA: NAD-dependent epimerase/dehydratase family protein [Clostridiales bacterium]|nr:NAD-dependent epimerase/dehydratase family protein [Clostridiales bacterium]
MKLKDVLNEYELDWATFVSRQKDYPFEKLKNKTIFVAGGQGFLAKAVVYFLLSLNDEHNLNISVSLVSSDSKILTGFFPTLMKRDDFKFYTTEMLTDVNNLYADFFIYSGCCNKRLYRTPEFFMEEIQSEKGLLNIAAHIKTGKFLLLSDYRIYGKVDRGVMQSEYENGHVDFSSRVGFEPELLQTLESLPAIYGKQYGFDYTIIRTGIALGAGAEFDDSIFTDMLKAVAKGETYTIVNSTHKYSFVYIHDIIKALFFSMTTLDSNTVYNVVGKDCTLSTCMMTAIIHDLYPEDTKITLSDSTKDPCYGVAMNNQKITCMGCEPEVTMADAIQLIVQYNRNKEETFLFQDNYQGKLETIHNILLGYLLEVDRICKKHNIRYFLAGGTLLGAVRHHGFIPWDDDADVMMLREDYEKFLEVASSELPNNIFVQTPKSESLNHCVFTKLRINDTMFSTAFTSRHLKMHNGIFFDVLSHDQTANSKLGRKIHLQLTLLTRSLVFNKWYGRRVDNGHKVQSAVANMLKVIFPMKFLDWCQYKCLRWFENKPDAKYLYDGMGRNVYKGDFLKSYLDEVIYWDFEGYRFPIPKEYDSYLRYLYGDYREMISPWDRQTSHSIVIMDLGQYGSYNVPAKYKKNGAILNDSNVIDEA